MSYKKNFIFIFAILLSTNILSAQNIINLPFEYSIVNDSTEIYANKRGIINYDFYNDKLRAIHIPVECITKDSQANFYVFGYEIDKLKNYLIYIKEKFIEWKNIALQDKVTSFDKYILLEGAKNISDIFKNNTSYLYPKEPGYHFENKTEIDNISEGYPYFLFVVDKNGKCSIRFHDKSDEIILRGTEKNTSTFGFWGTKITSDINPFIVKAHKIIFTTPEQIQSLIDALNIDKAKSMYEKQHNTVDQLFK